MTAAVPPISATSHVDPMAAHESLAFADVYRNNFSFVWRSVRCLGVRPPAMDDVVQEIFIAVHRGLPAFAGRSSVRTWVSGIVLNVVRHHRRSLVRKSPHELSREPPADPEALRATDANPHQAAELAEGTRLLQQLLDELDYDKREVLVLAELEEMPVPEIADALGLKLNTAYSRLRLAREELDKALARHRAQERWRPA
jgi:RNA polymerase sigma-70 factor (ECF subfamily)